MVLKEEEIKLEDIDWKEEERRRSSVWQAIEISRALEEVKSFSDFMAITVLIDAFVEGDDEAVIEFLEGVNNED